MPAASPNLTSCSPSLAVSASLNNALLHAPLLLSSLPSSPTSSSLSPPPSSSNPPLPFGRQSFPPFDAVTASHSSQARSLLRISYESHLLSPSSPFPSLLSLSPLASTSAPLIAALLLESLALLPESLEGLGGAYGDLVAYGTELLESPADPIGVVAAVEETLVW